MTFRYLITDLHEGCILGTNDKKVALELAESEDHFVADTKTGKWLQTNGESEIIKELP